MPGPVFLIDGAVYGAALAGGALGPGPVLNVGFGLVGRVLVGRGDVEGGVKVGLVWVWVGVGVLVEVAGAWVVGGGGGGGSLASPTPDLGGKSITLVPASAPFMKAVQISVG